jgi:hypothetical protein
MTKGEVHGLQKLALAHGGTLTINPVTGLAEANFLKSILPMVAGAGAMMIPGMQGVGAGWIAAGLGGATALASGSLKKGLMAGLGAYGGASLASGLMGAGALGAAEAGVGLASENAATQAALQQNALTNIGIPSSAAAGTGSMSFAPNTGLNVLGNAAQASGPMSVPVTTSQLISGVPQVATATAMPIPPPTASPWESIKAGAAKVTESPKAFGSFLSDNKYPLMAGGISAIGSMEQPKLNAPETNQGMIRPYTFSRTQNEQPDALGALYTPGQSTRERQYFTDQYTAGTPYKAPGPEYMAAGGPVEAMSNANAVGANTGYPMANIKTGAYATPTQVPISQNVVQGSQDSAVDPYTGQAQFADGGEVSSGIISSILAQERQDKRPQYANNSVGGFDYNQGTGAFSRSPEVQQPNVSMGGPFNGFFDMLRNRTQAPQYSNGSVGGYEYAGNNQFTQQPAMANGGGISTLGGKSDLGGYSDGGQLLRGPGDGVSDNIPAMIGQKQHARLADGEFVVPARIVSELGNGSTEAGSRQLYAMMDRVQKARKKSIGKGKVATNTRAAKLLPA